MTDCSFFAQQVCFKGVLKTCNNLYGANHFKITSPSSFLEKSAIIKIPCSRIMLRDQTHKSPHRFTWTRDGMTGCAQSGNKVFSTWHKSVTSRCLLPDFVSILFYFIASLIDFTHYPDKAEEITIEGTKDTKIFPGQPRHATSPACPPSSSSTYLEHLTQKVTTSPDSFRCGGVAAPPKRPNSLPHL